MNNYLRKSILILFSICPFILLGQGELAIEAIPDSLQKSAHSVIRWDNTTVTIEEGKVEYFFDRAVSVLEPKHENMLGFYGNYTDGEKEIDDLEINIYDGEGDLIKKVGKKDYKDFLDYDASLVTDSRVKYYSYNPSSYPVTIHVKYKYIDKSPVTIIPWYVYSSFNQSVESTFLEIIEKDDLQLKVNEINSNNYFSKDSEKLRYEANQLKPIFKEKYMPSSISIFPHLEFSLGKVQYFGHPGFINGWSDFGRWLYSEMFIPKIDVDQEDLILATNSYVTDKMNKVKTAKELYRYLQDHTRYILITLEDGGWSPIAVSKVHENKYGDCKALSLYYKLLCEAYDIEAKLALVYADSEKRSANESFYSPSQFNHVIVNLEIEDEDYWVECTSKTNPFNYLGQFTDDRKVLLFDEDISEIRSTPTYPKSKNWQYNFTVKEDQSMKGKLALTTHGNGLSSKLYQIPNMSEKELEEYYADVIFDEFDQLVVNKYSNKEEIDSLKYYEEFDFTLANSLNQFGEYYQFKLGRGELSVPKLPKDKNRKWPILFSRTADEVVVSSFKLPSGWTIIPEEDILLTSKFGTYIYKTTIELDQFEVRRELSRNEGWFSQEDYSEMKTFFDKIRKIEQRKILINTKT